MNQKVYVSDIFCCVSGQLAHRAYLLQLARDWTLLPVQLEFSRSFDYLILRLFINYLELFYCKQIQIFCHNTLTSFFFLSFLYEFTTFFITYIQLCERIMTKNYEFVCNTISSYYLVP